MTMYRIGGYLQNYDWGREGGLNPWLPADEHSESPQAELWFGAHAHGSSPLLDEPGTLDDVVDPAQVPLLVKLLAAEKPLSIQLHPDRELAETLFEQGSPLVSDPFAKVELLLAMEPFAIFAGWRDPSMSRQIFTRAGGFDDVVSALAQPDLRKAVDLLIDTPPSDVSIRFNSLLQAVQEVTRDAEELHALALAAQSHPGDPGLLALILLDHHLLRVHDAVFMPVGGVHSYVQGLGLEVMTSSDNVLRLGLTNKPVAPEEAMAAIRDDGDPHFLGPDSAVHLGTISRFDYHPEGAPFMAAIVRDSTSVLAAGAYRLVLCIGGETVVSQDDQVLALHPGQAAVILADSGDAEITVSGTAAVVRNLG